MLLVLVLVWIECNGVLVDVNLLGIQSCELGEKMVVLECQVYDLVGQEFNFGLFKQFGVIFYDKFGLLVLSKIVIGQLFIVEVVFVELVEQDFELFKVIMQYCFMSKFKSIYIDCLFEQINLCIGCIYILYYQVVVVIGWLLLSDLNLQNILICIVEGWCICQVFVVLQGYKLLVVDYLQIELWIMVYLVKDDGLLDVFCYDLDVYCVIVVEVFGVLLEDVSGDQ